jgi:hypothetical protein
MRTMMTPLTTVRSLPLLFVFSVAAAGTPQRLPASITGDYSSNWDDVRLVQEGSRVHGTYVCCGGGTIEGRILEGRVIRYHWRGGGEGEGIWTITPSGRLEGTWGSGASVDDGGDWTLEPRRQLAQ